MHDDGESNDFEDFWLLSNVGERLICVASVKETQTETSYINIRAAMTPCSLTSSSLSSMQDVMVDRAIMSKVKSCSAGNPLYPSW